MLLELQFPIGVLQHFLGTESDELEESHGLLIGNGDVLAPDLEDVLAQRRARLIVRQRRIDAAEHGELVDLRQKLERGDGSSRTGAEEEEMIARLLAVESVDEPTEIVIHVNMLKEGWDVTNCSDVLDTKKAWASRWEWLDKMSSFDSFDAIDAARVADGMSLALLRPKRLLGLDITKARNPNWTDEEREKLLQEQMQGNLFSEVEERKQVKQLRKVPFDFHYRYVCDTPDGEKEHKHKIVDWEAGALFWNCRQRHGVDWEKPFRAKLEEDLGSKELMFLMGNQHRFQDQWLIVSLIYPPKRKPVDERQMSLL